MKEVKQVTFCGWIDGDCPYVKGADTIITCDRCKKERDKQKKNNA